jgi:hypothetical protein
MYAGERAQNATESGGEWVKQKEEQEKILRDLDDAAERARTEQTRKPDRDRQTPTRQRKR